MHKICTRLEAEPATKYRQRLGMAIYLQLIVFHSPDSPSTNNPMKSFMDFLSLSERSIISNPATGCRLVLPFDLDPFALGDNQQRIGLHEHVDWNLKSLSLADVRLQSPPHAAPFPRYLARCRWLRLPRHIFLRGCSGRLSGTFVPG